VSASSCRSTPGQARVTVEEDEHSRFDREADQNDHPQPHGFSEHTANHEDGEQATAMA
jgi:hypothetical protein